MWTGPGSTRGRRREITVAANPRAVQAATKSGIVDKGADFGEDGARRIHGAHSGAVGGVLIEKRHQARGVKIVAIRKVASLAMPYPVRVASWTAAASRCTETTHDGRGANVPVNAETPIDWVSAVEQRLGSGGARVLDIRRNAVTSIGR